MDATGKTIEYKGTKVKVVERNKWQGEYWVEALEPVGKYKVGEQFTISESLVQSALQGSKKGRAMRLTTDELREIADTIDSFGNQKLGRERICIETEHGTQEIKVYVSQKNGLAIESIKTL